MDQAFDYDVLEKIVEKNGTSSSSIIAILQATQEVYRYLPQEIFPYFSKKTGLSEAKIYGIATFYENFSLEPKGKVVIKICDGTACHVRKSIPILQRLRKDLNLSETKHTSDDMNFTLETVSCLGGCGLAPVITVNDKVFGSMTPDAASTLIAGIKEEMSDVEK